MPQVAAHGKLYGTVTKVTSVLKRPGFAAQTFEMEGGPRILRPDQPNLQTA